jgi:hypothetical protein
MTKSGNVPNFMCNKLQCGFQGVRNRLQEKVKISCTKCIKFGA